MKIYFHYSAPGFSNGYIIGNEETGKAIIIDPGIMDSTLLNHIEQNRFLLDAVLITHSHENHFRGLKTLLKIYAPKVYAADTELSGQKTVLLQGDGSFEAADFTIMYYAVPGHSPDSVLYQIGNVVFTGDSITAGLLGDTNNIYGKKNLLNNLQNKLFKQSKELFLFPGHGPPTTLEAERLFNFELIQSSLSDIVEANRTFQLFDTEQY
ncbi:MBL fold metallo-hydrolase [Brucepastera parasyntrophica]|uniref:MBL fold metallo-hydrolase n=1 Tax=Brucepastera parasyntrophica TaxID=2880008 RepID=UPI00210A7F09|nr:MBL fold metallo-hydrolase [Brucepastera parasyntrophica]ULQ59561.1 MBL fold metallo-hydrolase [Brucepastera parasyntrophica]